VQSEESLFVIVLREERRGGGGGGWRGFSKVPRNRMMGRGLENRWSAVITNRTYQMRLWSIKREIIYSWGGVDACRDLCPYQGVEGGVVFPRTGGQQAEGKKGKVRRYIYMDD